MQLTEKQVLAIKRKRGELDLTMNALAEITGVNKWTLIDIFKHHHRNVNSITFKKLKADAQLNTSVGALINVIHEKYPKLNSDSRVHDLMVELEGSENRISVERHNYIQRVKDYNKLVRNFPSSAVAQSKNMHVMNYYQANSQAYNAPKVDLD